MYDFSEYENFIKNRLSEHRYFHSVCVAQRAAELAEKYYQNPKKAYLAGILHDVTKEESLENQLRIISSSKIEMTEVELNTPNVYHQISGAAFVKDELKIQDKDIISGIRYHTTGKSDMTIFEAIIYLADFTSKDRNYPDVEIMRKKTDASLLEGLYYSLRYTISNLTEKGVLIHPDTLNCYNWVLGQIEN